MVIKGICEFVCVCVCLCVCPETGKWLELSTPNLVHIYYMAGSQNVKGQGHMVTKIVTGAWLLVKCAAVAGVALHIL